MWEADVAYTSLDLFLSGESTEDKIRSFMQLPEGWHYGEGGPPAQRTVNSALAIFRAAHNYGFLRTDSFPGIGGEIRVTAYQGPHYLEFTVAADRRITFVRELDNVEVACEENLSLGQAKSMLHQMADQIWSLSDLLAQGTSINRDSVSRAGRSRTQARTGVAGSPSSTRTVSPPGQVPLYANTSGAITSQPLGMSSSSGKYRQIYQPVAA